MRTFITLGPMDSCGAAKTRMLNLYHLKDAVLKKLQEEDRVEYLGVNRQVFDYGPDSFLRLYRIGDFTFHIPCQKDEVNELEILDERFKIVRSNQIM